MGAYMKSKEKVADNLADVERKNAVDQDLVDKIRCLNGYLMMWRDDKKKPHELEDLIAEVDEWVTENSC
jgi:hypothetical protein